MKLSQVSIAELAEGLREGRFTSFQLVQTYIARINQLNPVVHAVSEINPDALAIAKEKDKERSDGVANGILHGIPILVKDLLLTTDRMHSTFGCSGLLDARPKFEATAISKLREAGAILLGKTTLTEWANYRNAARASGGWSAVGKQGLAPYHKDQDTSGSSSGSAVAAALGLAAAALGTETSGSISSPAQKAAVVGIKPTVGLTSRYGVYCVSEWQDTVGVLASSVRDAALILTAIAGVDENDPFTVSDPRDSGDVQKPQPGTDFAAACDPLGLQGLRIAVPRHILSKDAVVSVEFDKSLKIMESLGAQIVDNTMFSEFNTSYTHSNAEEWNLGLQVDIYNNMERSLANFETNPHQLHTLTDVIRYTIETPDEENEKWGVDEWLACEKAGQKYTSDSDKYHASISRRNHIGRQIPELLAKYSCDILVVPSNVDSSANVGGCPTVAVPLGFYPEDTPIQRQKSSQLVTTGPNIPFGLLFVGQRFDDERLIAAAYAFEQATRVRDRVDPIIQSDIELGGDQRAALVRETL